MDIEPGHAHDDDSSRTLLTEALNQRIHRHRIFQVSKAMVREYGAAMLWHRWIDENLTSAIKSKLKPIKGPLERLFKFPGGLSTFSARMHLGSLLELYGPVTYGDLGIINDIRNGFAHPNPEPKKSGELEILGFDHPEISKMCKNLAYINARPLFTESRRKALTAEKRYCITAEQIAMHLSTYGIPGQLRPEEKNREALP